jgi:hypothetical protein
MNGVTGCGNQQLNNKDRQALNVFHTDIVMQDLN